MKKMHLFAMVLYVCLYWSQIYAQDWQLVWSDEFNGPDIDLTKWEHEVNGWGGGNNELQYYTARDTNSYIENGSLVIRALQEIYTGPDGTRQFTSARLRTMYKGDWEYGRFEISAKLPYGQGLWPAIWMLPTDWVYGGWAASGEIDIMELIGHQPNVIHGTLHYGGAYPQNTHSGSSYTLPSGTFSDAYHEFALEWEPGVIRWYLDGLLYATQTSWYTPGGVFPAPFDKRFHMLLNVAVGGNWPGPPGPSTQFPQKMYVDYVRVYRNNNTQPTVSITAPGAGTVLPANTPFTITAEAADSNGTIQLVEFYQGVAKLGEDNQAPYEYIVQNPLPGTYELTAKATDNSGASTVSGSVTIGVSHAAAQSPYLISPYKIPGTIEVENFDMGGEGIAYHDADAGNNGNKYRLTEDVDIELTTDTGGGYNVGWNSIGEWFEFTVDVEADGIYAVSARVASLGGGGSFHLEMDGQAVTGSMLIPDTGGWQNWISISENNISLQSGIQTLRVEIDSEGFNLNNITFAGVTGLDDEVPANLANNFKLYQNFPNPFNPETTINYQIGRKSPVKLYVVDITGKIIEKLVDENKEAGDHKIKFNGEALGSGIYFYRLETPEFTDIRRMVLLK